MSYTQIYLHVVFAVKKKEPLLTEDRRCLLFTHIKEQALAKRTQVIVINGYEDHVHLLLRLTSSQTVSGLMQQIKGESSWWANHVQLFASKLRWAKGYYARSIDPDKVITVTKYITSQPYKHALQSQWLHQYLQTVLEDKNREI